MYIISVFGNEKVYGGLSVDDIRDLSGEQFNCFPHYDCSVVNDIVFLKLKIINVNKIPLDDLIGNKYAENLSLKSNTHNFIFKSFSFDKFTTDLNGYDPGKISVGTFSSIKESFINLVGTLK